MIHGFVWCNTALCDMCLVTEMGLELVKLAPKLDGVKLVKHERRSVNWFQYYHPCRTLLLWYVYLYSTLGLLSVTANSLTNLDIYVCLKIHINTYIYIRHLIARRSLLAPRGAVGQNRRNENHLKKKRDKKGRGENA